MTAHGGFVGDDDTSQNEKDSSMIINTFSYLWVTTAEDAIAELTEHGYSSFEIPISSPHCWPDDMSDAERSASRTRLEASGAGIRSLNAGGYDINLASPGSSVRRRSIDHIKSVIDLAALWGASEVVISPGTRRPMISPPLDRVHGWMYESLERLLPMAEEAGVRLLLENTPYCIAPTIEDLMKIVNTVEDESLKIVYDVANAAYIGEDPVRSLRTHHDAIGLVHISDTGRDVWGHDPIGTGVVDFAGLGAAVGETCGPDNVVLEIIREENPLVEFNKAMQALSAGGWALEGVTR